MPASWPEDNDTMTPDRTPDRSLSSRLTSAPTIFAVLAGWTLFNWTTRIRNVLGDDELAGFDRAWRLGVSVAFVAVALLVIATLIARRHTAAAHVSRALAVAGILWWPVRAIGTLLADFSVAFKVVHTVLAVVTVTLGVLVLRARAGNDAEASTASKYQVTT